MPAHKKQDPNNKYLHIRINKETENKLDYVSKRDSVSKSEVIRRGIDDEYYKSKED